MFPVCGHVLRRVVFLLAGYEKTSYVLCVRCLFSVFYFCADFIMVGVVLGFVNLGWASSGMRLWDRWDSMGQYRLSRWFAFIFQGLGECE